MAGLCEGSGCSREDVDQGFFNQLRSLPVPRIGLISGPALGDVVIVAWGGATTVLGVLAGFRLRATSAGACSPSACIWSAVRLARAKASGGAAIVAHRRCPCSILLDVTTRLNPRIPASCRR
jgi:hypothetical protein